MALPVHTTESPDQPGYDGPELPGIAQINDYWLDGDHHEPADRELADKFAVVAPHIPYLVRTQRALLGRIVRHLTELGITQFLDLGSGIPTCGHVHELAPSASVVYVDNDPRVVAVARDVLAGTGNAVLLDEDLREPDRVLAAAAETGLLDPARPLGVLMIEALVHLRDAEQPADLVARYVDAVSSGSCVAISHCAQNDRLVEAFELFERMMLGSRPAVNLRPREVLAGYFTGLDLIEPGVVPITLWHPDSEDEVDRNPDQVLMHVGVGRKP